MTEPGPTARNSDITEARLSEQASRDQGERHALVARASSEGIYDWNVVTNQLYTSPRLRELLGLGESDPANIDWNRRIHPDDFDRYRQALIAHFKRQLPKLRSEYRVRVRSGEYRWFLDSGLAVRDDAGRCTRLVGAISDITERKNAEDALRESEERYALAMKAVNEAVYDWRIDRDEIYYSPNIHLQLRILGRRAAYARRLATADPPGRCRPIQGCDARAFQGPDAAFRVYVSLSRAGWKLAMGQAARHRAARYGRPRVSHDRCHGRHHRRETNRAGAGTGANATERGDRSYIGRVCLVQCRRPVGPLQHSISRVLRRSRRRHRAGHAL